MTSDDYRTQLQRTVYNKVSSLDDIDYIVTLADSYAGQLALERVNETLAELNRRLENGSG